MHVDIVIEIRYETSMPSMARVLARNKLYDAAAYVSCGKVISRSVLFDSEEKPVLGLPSITDTARQAFYVCDDDVSPPRSFITNHWAKHNDERTDHILEKPSFPMMATLAVDTKTRFLIETSLSLDDARKYSTFKLLSDVGLPCNAILPDIYLCVPVDILDSNWQKVLYAMFLSGVDNLVITDIWKYDATVLSAKFDSSHDVVKSIKISDLIAKFGARQFVSELEGMPDIFIPQTTKIWFMTGSEDNSINGPFTWQELFDARIEAGQGILGKK